MRNVLRTLKQWRRLIIGTFLGASLVVCAFYVADAIPESRGLHALWFFSSVAAAGAVGGALAFLTEI